MFKLMKYEIIGTCRFMLGVILTVLVASTGIQLYAKNQMSILMSSPGAIQVWPFIIMLLIFAIIGAVVVSLFYIVSSFRKELYEDRGYLTFTLPLSGKQILGAKLLIAFMWFAALGLSVVGYNLALSQTLFGNESLLNQSIELGTSIGSIAVSMSIPSLFSGISTILLVYFSITLSKISLKNQRIGGIWFVIFLILYNIAGYFSQVISERFPFFINSSTFEIFTRTELMNRYGSLDLMWMDGNVSLANPGLVGIGEFMSLTGMIFHLILAILLFICTSYLLERKVDL